MRAWLDKNRELTPGCVILLHQLLVCTDEANTQLQSLQVLSSIVHQSVVESGM